MHVLFVVATRKLKSDEHWYSYTRPPRANHKCSPAQPITFVMGSPNSLVHSKRPQNQT